MKQVFLYKNIFMYASLQFCGHIDEYFIKHTEKVIIFYMMPRVKNVGNKAVFYEKGKLIQETTLRSSENVVWYYILWYVQYLYHVTKYFSRRDKVIVLSGHPISFFGMMILHIWRNCIFAYWVGDYFPPVHIYLRVFEKLKKFYHDRVSYTYYLSDRINQELNGAVVHTDEHKTVMWGVKRVSTKNSINGSRCSLLFVGLVKGGQGLELVYRFLKKHKDYRLNIIGVCDEGRFHAHNRRISSLGIQGQVYFPNKFFSDQELIAIAKHSDIGIAVYDASPNSATYYTDPGKVKAYIELGLPVVMSDTSAIADYIKKFSCGEVIKPSEETMEKALGRIKKDYGRYCDGIKRFINHFSYEHYYQKSFTSLEYTK